MFKRASAYAAIAAAVTAITLAVPATASPPMPPNPAITPGAGVTIYDSSRAFAGACTVAFLATGADGAHFAFTAGHCASDGNVLLPYQAEGNFQRIGSFGQVDNGSVADIAVIRLDGALPLDDRVLSRRPVTGVTSQVSRGDSLCYYGMRSGRQCGTATIDAAASGVIAVFSGTATHGDSGAPVYKVAPDGAATAVGVLNASTDHEVTATLIAPYLTKWGLALDTTHVPSPALPVGYQPSR